MNTARLTIPDRFNGPPDSGHGGYVCGRLAALWAAQHGGPAAVTLLEPPPLETPMEVQDSARRMSLWHGDRLIATMTAGPRRPPVVPAVTAAQAEAAEDCFLGSAEHPFPTCFVCGSGRSTGGLRLRPGPVAGRPGTVACRWVPEGERGSPVPSELVWSVLDCPSGWVEDPRARPAVLTRMTAHLVRPVCAGQQHVVVASKHEWRERTATNHSAIYDPDGVLVGCATMVWTALAADEPTTDSDWKTKDSRHGSAGMRP